MPTNAGVKQTDYQEIGLMDGEEELKLLFIIKI